MCQSPDTQIVLFLYPRLYTSTSNSHSTLHMSTHDLDTHNSVAQEAHDNGDSKRSFYGSEYEHFNTTHLILIC